jgi:D-3-phosphoglycerate dehydrogenase / 2-oxoglutarate reductase
MIASDAAIARDQSEDPALEQGGRPTILVTGPDLAAGATELLTRGGYVERHVPPYTPGDALVDLVARTDPCGVIVRMGRFDAAAMDAAPSLKVISKHGVGVDNIDVEAATERGIPVMVASGANAISVAEHTIALLLAVTKQIVPLDASMRAGRWEKPGFVGRELAGTKVGLVGFGAIAQHAARFARGLGLDVTAFDPFADQATFEEAGVARHESVDVLIENSDIISLHCPLTPETRHLLNETRIRKAKRGVTIVNTARGGLIDEAALLLALRDGHIAGAGLDSFETEPPRVDHPFWGERNVVVTPHVAGVTAEASARVSVEAVRNVLAVLEGGEVDPARVMNGRQLAARGLLAAQDKGE